MVITYKNGQHSTWYLAHVHYVLERAFAPQLRLRREPTHPFRVSISGAARGGAGPAEKGGLIYLITAIKRLSWPQTSGRATKRWRGLINYSSFNCRFREVIFSDISANPPNCPLTGARSPFRGPRLFWSQAWLRMSATHLLVGWQRLALSAFDIATLNFHVTFPAHVWVPDRTRRRLTFLCALARAPVIQVPPFWGGRIVVHMFV